MKNKLQQLKDEIVEQLNTVSNNEVLRDFENKYLSRKGKLGEMMKEIKDLSEEARKEIGQFANDTKQEINNKYLEVKRKFEASGVKNEFIDVTLPGESVKHGHIHPITLIQKELEDLFTSLGFIILDGPELESDFYNFEALNVSKHHPARDMQDTFYIDKKNDDDEYDLVMRTQTSPVQIRALEKHGAPLKGISVGRVFRSEATDVRHEHTFYQMEGLMVGENISFADMKGVLELVGKKLYGPKTELRMRPKFYPFVEPGSNGEYTCFLCGGKGCRLCKDSGWLEILGCGMIHPEVLRAGGVDPEKYTGFAFGFGLNRLVMLKYGIDDIRLFNGGDMRFLEQF
ncbi:MAG: phenylalanine--tRNA ligase subunit alpha [Candidatus Falkowbacteria bacterium]